MVALSVSSSPSISDIEVLLRDTLVTGIFTLVTVTLQVAVLPPSSVVTVIVALPSECAVTLPLASTLAALGLSLLQVSPCSVASSGLIVALSVSSSPSTSDIEVLLRDTLVTGM